MTTVIFPTWLLWLLGIGLAIDLAFKLARLGIETFVARELRQKDVANKFLLLKYGTALEELGHDHNGEFSLVCACGNHETSPYPFPECSNECGELMRPDSDACLLGVVVRKHHDADNAFDMTMSPLEAQNALGRARR